jgi:putative transposase
MIITLTAGLQPMPQISRLQFPGSFYHIMARGIDGHNLFNDDDDHYEFLKRLAKSLLNSGYRCITWNLMDNHYHLFVHSSEKPLCSLMRPLNSGYARWYNKKNKRHGYLFQSPFKSVLCQNSHHLSELIRYIHLNPLRANLIDSYAKLSDWKWSGHNLLLNNADAIGADFVDRKAMLDLFNQNENDALEMYHQYMLEGIDNSNLRASGWLPKTEQIELDSAQKRGSAVIGDLHFVRNAMENNLIGLRHLHRKDDYSDVLRIIASKTCSEFDITLDDLKKRGRKNIRSRAREYFCYKVHEEEKLPLGVIANFLVICISPTAELVKRGKSVVEKLITASTHDIQVQDVLIQV